MRKLKNYNLFLVLVTGGAIWFIVVIFFYPTFKSDQDFEEFDLHGNIAELKLNNHARNKLANSKKGNKRLKISKLKSNATIEYGEFLPPPNIFGIDNLGELGVAVSMPPNLPKNIQEIYDDGWSKQQFNQYLSDLISVRRELPDYRTDYCKKAEYSENLPATSVIIIFHNEGWSTLLRTVYSVLDRSPENLISEVILVDDFSDLGE